MCGVFNLEHDIVAYLKSQGLEFFLDEEETLTGDFFPKGNSLVLRGSEIPHIKKLKWFYDIGDGKTNAYNCRAESIFEKKLFKTSIENRRCLIPISRYYEWTGKKGEKIKHIIYSNEDKPLFLGGIFNKFRIDDEVFEGFSIVTKESVGDIKSVHHRMPVIIEESDIFSWLKKGTDSEKIYELLNKKVFLQTKLF